MFRQVVTVRTERIGELLGTPMEQSELFPNSDIHDNSAYTTKVWITDEEIAEILALVEHMKKEKD